jgi:hypothetical protein
MLGICENSMDIRAAELAEWMARLQIIDLITLKFIGVPQILLVRDSS